MAKITQTANGVTGLTARTNFNTAMKTVEVMGVITGTGEVGNPISHNSSDGNKHVPANGTANNGKVLTAGAVAGESSWETPASGVTDHTLLSNIGANTHAELDTLIAGKKDSVDAVGNESDSFTSYPKVSQIISLTQIEYDGITPDVNTLYVVI